MNLTQSPPRFGNKSPKNGKITAENGNFIGFIGNFFWGGRKTKQK